MIVYRLINLLYDGRAQTLHAQSIHLTDSSCSLILLCHVVRVAIRSPNGVLGYHELRATDHQANVAFLVFSDRSVIQWQFTYMCPLGQGCTVAGPQGFYGIIVYYIVLYCII